MAKWYLFLSMPDAVNNVLELSKACFPKTCIRLMQSSIMRSPLGRTGTGMLLCFLGVVCCIPLVQRLKKPRLDSQSSGSSQPLTGEQGCCTTSVPLCLERQQRKIWRGSAAFFPGLWSHRCRGSPEQRGGDGLCSWGNFLVRWFKRFFLTHPVFCPLFSCFTPVKSYDDYTCWKFSNCYCYFSLFSVCQSLSVSQSIGHGGV